MLSTALRSVVAATLVAAVAGPPALAQTRVDAALAPAVAAIPGFAAGDAARPLGRVAGDDGATDLVRDEIIVRTDSRAVLDGVLARWDGTVVDSFSARPGGLTAYLVRIASGPHGSALPARRRVDSAATRRVLAVVAHERVHEGNVVSPNWIATADGIASGHLHEATDAGNPFDWPYISSQATQRVGLDAAWQLLEAHGELTHRDVKVMVSDGGFKLNDDYPWSGARTIREAAWGTENSLSCGGNPCPFHGSDVVMTLMGELDNDYGSAGPAGPVARLIAVQAAADTYTRYSQLADLVHEYRPDVVNMSWSNSFDREDEPTFDAFLKAMADDGALLVASAGNSGSDVDAVDCSSGTCVEPRASMPCESRHVLCVGGLRTDSVDLHPSSNFGSSDDARTVEIYGPFCTVGLRNHDLPHGDAATRTTLCGTSFSSPFVAGVAALVKAANSDLDAGEIRNLLLASAQGRLRRRIDAAEAVSRALGVPFAAPTITIDSPVMGKTYPVSEWVTLKARTSDFRGAELPVAWHSSRDGALTGAPVAGPFAVADGLSAGTHTITATVTDIRGTSTSAKVTITVVKQPPFVAIAAPAPGTRIYANEQLRLSAGSQDPDALWQPLASGQVKWQLRPYGQATVLLERAGHTVTLAAGTLLPGAYSIRFVGNAGPGASADDWTTVVVQAVPAGVSVPRPVISAPAEATQLSTSTGTVSVRLQGYATDADEGALSGRRLRWVARAGAHERVLCTGSSFPSNGAFGPDTLAESRDCSDVTVALPPPPTAPVSSAWSIELEAADSGNVIGRATRMLTVRWLVV